MQFSCLNIKCYKNRGSFSSIIFVGKTLWDLFLEIYYQVRNYYWWKKFSELRSKWAYVGLFVFFYLFIMLVLQGVVFCFCKHVFSSCANSRRTATTFPDISTLTRSINSVLVRSKLSGDSSDCKLLKKENRSFELTWWRSALTARLSNFLSIESTLFLFDLMHQIVKTYSKGLGHAFFR